MENLLVGIMKLITFGCSWTYGVGAAYTNGESYKEYRKDSMDYDIISKFAFRTLLANRLDLENINLSSAGSSNQKQQRKALEYFRSDNKDEWKDSIVVWGITSTTRNEMWINKENKYRNFLYQIGNTLLQENLPFSVEQFVDWFYDRNNEINRLCYMMDHWNQFFENLGIRNIWFNTFNTYVYPREVKRLIKRDLLTQMTRPHLRDEHFSVWKEDSKRIREAKKKKLVNPYSLHPTKEGHIQIADILEKYIQENL